MTHSELVAKAAKWLRNSAQVPYIGMAGTHKVKCGVVLTEYTSGTTETPDAIGWYLCGRVSILIECKATRGDFLRDKRKHFRKFGRLGMGCFRYYLANPGIIKPQEIPANWGLLICESNLVRIEAWPTSQMRDVTSELALLWSECRKIQIVEKGGELLQTRAGKRIHESINGQEWEKTQ